MLIRRISTVSILALLAGTLFAVQVPRRSPEFAINMVNGKQLLLSQYHGKAVALLFVLTYCPHCQLTTQMLTKLQYEYGPRGFQVIGSAIEDMAKMAVPDFVKRLQPSFPVGYSDRNSVLEYLQHPAMLRMMMPQLVFIDREGMIRAQYSGDDAYFGPDQEKNLRQSIESLLKENVPVRKTHAVTKARKRG
ncbi:MAG: TlpA family protein disulfide reductase [Acidobacteria bacterium]|nr:TlpA family protein disulfide reductase [Acidobacteriota bacterium]